MSEYLLLYHRCVVMKNYMLAHALSGQRFLTLNLLCDNSMKPKEQYNGIRKVLVLPNEDLQNRDQ